MQRQLNEQEGKYKKLNVSLIALFTIHFLFKATTVQINALLAEKSRENSELQIKLNEITGKFDTELEEVLEQNEELKGAKELLERQLTDTTVQLESQLGAEIKNKTGELTALRKELNDYKRKYDEVIVAHQTSDARSQTLEDLVKQLKKGSKAEDIGELMDTTNMKAKILALTKEKDRLTDKLEGELDARKLLEDHVKVVSEEVSAMRQGYTQAEKDKLEAQTKLDVLSTYFKEKETQLQK